MNARTLTAVALASVLLACSGGALTGGNSSDTGNVVAVAHENGRITVTAATPATVGLYAAGYLPFADSGYGRSATADSGAPVAFVNLEPGAYNVFVFGGDGSALCVAGVTVGADAPDGVIADTLRPAGSVGGVAVSAADGAALLWNYTYIPGSPFVDYTGYDGAFLFDGVPAGTYELAFYGYTPEVMSSAEIQLQPAVLEAEASIVTVAPGARTEWRR